MSVCQSYKFFLTVILTGLFIFFIQSNCYSDNDTKPTESIAVFREKIATDSCLESAVRDWLAIAEIYIKKGEHKEALKELDALSTLFSGKKEIKEMKFHLLSEMARTYAKQNNYRESEHLHI